MTPPRRKPPRRPSRVERTAYHEAGHAVAAYLRHLRFTSVSIVPDRGTLGRCEFSEAPIVIDLSVPPTPHTRARVETLIVVSLAGVIAECLLTGRHNWRGAHADLHDAARYAESLAGSDAEASAYARWLWEHTRVLLSAPRCWLAVQRLAAALAEDGRVGERRARALIASALRPPARRPKRKARARHPS
jgi:hypothetical protein